MLPIVDRLGRWESRANERLRGNERPVYLAAFGLAAALLAGLVAWPWPVPEGLQGTIAASAILLGLGGMHFQQLHRAEYCECGERIDGHADANYCPNCGREAP